MTSNIINSAGLALDIVGVILIFKYGLPLKLKHPEDPALFTWGRPEGEEKRKLTEQRNRYQFRSRLGRGLLILGFALQIASNHVAAPDLLVLPAVTELGSWSVATAG